MFNRTPLVLLWLFIIYIKFSNGQNCIIPEGEHCLTEQSSQEGVEKRITNCLSQGEKCFITQTGAEGIGRLITQCPLLCSNDKNGKHKKCGKSPEGIPIVCCPVKLHQRISAQKCQDYMEFACDKSHIANVHNRSLMHVKTSNCVFNVVPLVSGGKEAKRREFPHMALIGYNHSDKIVWGCGGSLISEQYVLTAGHCLKNIYYNVPATVARLGEHDWNRTEEATTIDLRIIQTFPYPSYKTTQVYDDIALLKLEREVELNGAIRPICLPEETDSSTNKFMVTGWGEDEQKKVSSVLMKAIVDLFSLSACNEYYEPESKMLSGILEATQLCAGSRSSEFLNNTCEGDSGGPLQIYHKTHFCSYTILGVTSIGLPCRFKHVPGVYTRVHPYLDWIESIVWPSQ